MRLSLNGRTVGLAGTAICVTRVTRNLTAGRLDIVSHFDDRILFLCSLDNQLEGFRTMLLRLRHFGLKTRQ